MQGDELALRAVKRESYYLGLGLADLVTLFAPDVIALGGGVMKSSSLFLDDAVKVVHDLCTQVPAEKTLITRSSLVGSRAAGSRAGMVMPPPLISTTGCHKSHLLGTAEQRQACNAEE